MKARHLPELLRFINENEPRKRFYIWGFEEPENSLDLGAAEAEARRFASFSAREDTQVFITSHSPAFYLANSDSQATIRRFFITKQVKSSESEMTPKNAAALIDKLEDAEAKMEQAGLLQLPFVIRQMGEQSKAIREKEEEAANLRAELAKLQQPTMFVEGPHDVVLFCSALARLGAGDAIAVKPLGGTPQTTDALLSAVLAQGGLSASATTIFLFDDDKAGRGALRKLCKDESLSEPRKCQENTFAWTLQWTDPFKKFTKRHNIKKDQAFFTAEFLFPAEEAAMLCAELANAHANEEIQNWKTSINGDYFPGLGQKKFYELVTAPEGSVDWFFSRGVPNGLKKLFAKEINARNVSTAAIDEAANKIKSILLG